MWKLPHFGAMVLAVLTVSPSALMAQPPAKVSGGERSAALDFLSAVASGDPRSVAYAVHPDDLKALRLRLLELLQAEGKRGDSTVRSRLFGTGMPLAEIERLTDTGFYVTLADKLHLAGREYAEVEGLAALPYRDDRVAVVIRGIQPKDHGTVSIVSVVALKPYGKDWKAALPDEIEAQIDDLIAGRGPAAKTGSAVALPAILELLDAASRSLGEGRCEDYYAKQMSPNFRRVTGKKALESLVASCQNGMGSRQLLLSTLRIVRGLEPRYENASRRAVYDLSGQGLPFQTFAVEQVDKRWFIAE